MFDQSRHQPSRGEDVPLSPRPLLSLFLSAVLGGLVVLGVGIALIATGVVSAGPTREVVQQAPITQPASDDSDGLTVNDIYKRDAPGVVFVQARGGQREESLFGSPERRDGTSSGSGFVLDRDGSVLTNAHVVQGAREVTVRFGGQDQDPVDARVVGADPSTDLAVLKVDTAAERLKPLALGNSDRVKVGDPTIAIGNPLGFDRTVTTGIVSAIGRTIPAPNRFSIDHVIQTDASINPGNSGGPLLDAAGRVIGINAQIATGGSQGSVGIGFAIPVNTAKAVVPQLKQKGRIERAYLGVTTAPVTGQVAEELRLPVDRGALVQDVVEGGPADAAGLRAGRSQTPDGLIAGGDVLVKVDDQEITKPEDVASAIADRKPGDEVTIEYLRGEERETTTATLGVRPAEAVAGGPEPGGPGTPDDEFPFP